MYTPGNVCRGIFIFFGLFTILAVSSPTLAKEGTTVDPIAARAELVDAYPGARVRASEDRVTVYGTPMALAEDPQDSCRLWLERHVGALVAATSVDLRETRASEVRFGQFRVFVFDQYIGGLRVERAYARVLVREVGDRYGVVLVRSDLASPPAASDEPKLDAEQVITRIRGHEDLGQMLVHSHPETVLIRLAPGQPAQRVARLEGHIRSESEYRSFAVYVNDITGEVVRVDDLLCHIDELTGSITGWATPGLGPNNDDNEPEEMPIAGAPVRIDGEDPVHADADGDYEICTDSTDEVTVIADLNGEWVEVLDGLLDPLEVEDDVTPPDTLDMELGDDTDVVAVDMLNAFIHVTNAHEFFASRSDDLDELDESVEVNVDIPFPCAAFFDPFFNVLGFGIASDGSGGFPFPVPECERLCYSTIIVHEYGHWVLDQLGLPQDVFGEGYGDALAVMVFDDPISGLDAFGEDTFGRNAETADIQAPCTDPDPHICGQILSGVWWDIKLNLQEELGDDDGLEETRQLFVDWTATTAGSDDGADEDVAIEILTLDDDDADLDNGTPNYDAICAAFDDHSIDCPEIIVVDPEFLRGDVDGNGSVSALLDALRLLEYGFSGADEPGCLDAADVDGNDTVSVLIDALALMDWAFAGGEDPPTPGTVECGPDVGESVTCLADPTCP